MCVNQVWWRLFICTYEEITILLLLQTCGARAGKHFLTPVQICLLQRCQTLTSKSTICSHQVDPLKQIVPAYYNLNDSAQLQCERLEPYFYLRLRLSGVFKSGNCNVLRKSAIQDRVLDYVKHSHNTIEITYSNEEPVACLKTFPDWLHWFFIWKPQSVHTSDGKCLLIVSKEKRWQAQRGCSVSSSSLHPESLALAPLF